MNTKLAALLTVGVLGAAGSLSSIAGGQSGYLDTRTTKTGNPAIDDLGKHAVGTAPDTSHQPDASIHYNSTQMMMDVHKSPARAENDLDEYSPNPAPAKRITKYKVKEERRIRPSVEAEDDRVVTTYDNDVIYKDDVNELDAVGSTTMDTVPMVGATDSTASLVDIFAKLHHSNMMEIEMGKLAMEKGQSEKVRRFGERIMRDHQMADRKLMAYADRHNIPLNKAETLTPVEIAAHRNMSSRLQNASVSEFDRVFLETMSSAHAKDVNELTSAIDRLDDRSAQNFLRKVRPILGQHADLSNLLLEKQSG